MQLLASIKVLLTIGTLSNCHRSQPLLTHLMKHTSDNMASWVESGKFGYINTIDTATNGFYVIMFTSEACALQDNKTIDGKIITAG